MGVLVYNLSDLKTTIQRKVLKKVAFEFQTSSFAETVAEDMASRTRKGLRTSLWQFQSMFQESFYDSERTQRELKNSLFEMDKILEFYRSVEQKTRVLRDALEQVKIDNA